MAQVINTNIASLNAQRNLNSSQAGSNQALERLSSGLRINSAKDDAAGLAISTRFQSQIKGLNVAMRNAGDGVSLAQTAEGSLGSMTDGLQRIRELAVQSANATNSDVDRQALQDEVGQLVAEITRLGEQTKFNGISLLDGSLSTQLQVGANVGESVSFSIGKLTSDNIGTAKTGGVSAVGSSSALGSGDLTINGVAIRASSAADDTASTSNAAASAISKVAAINASSAETGVSAVVSTNTVAGTDMTAAAASGTITINGTAISVTTTGDAASSRTAVVEAINAKSEQTGVIAVDTGDDDQGVTLTAADGRNITTSFTTVTAASTGIAAASTYTGGYTLVADSATSSITVTGGDGTAGSNIANSGLAAGTYTAGTASVTSTAQTVAGGGTANALTTGDLKINGVAIGASSATDDTASDTTYTSSSGAASGISIAAAINRSTDATGVTATVNATTVVGGTAAQITAAGAAGVGDDADLYINGVSVGTMVGSADQASDINDTVDLINAAEGQTGVTATYNGGSITLVAADGRNISVAIDSESGGLGANFGLAAASTGIGEAQFTTAATTATATAETTYSTVTLSSASEINVSAGVNGNTGLAGVGLEIGNFGGSTEGQYVKDIDISTLDGANTAIVAIDNALASVSSERSKLGAVQNRLESTISNLAVVSENLTAANSRIQDADFAQEAASLSRSKILQQAGISILSQANAAPQQVLSLLQ